MPTMTPEQAIDFLQSELRRFQREPDQQTDDALAVLRAALTWRPIEEAPKDSTRILAVVHNGTAVAIVRWHNRNRHYDSGWYDDDGGEVEPTHWMPLPPQPEVSDG